MGDALVRADEAGAELDPDRAHLEVSGDRLAAADPAGDEHRDVVADVGQDFLRQHRGRDRADMAAGLHPLDHQRVGPERISFLASDSAGAKAISLAPLALILVDRPAGRQPAGEHDMADAMLRADVDQLGRAAGAW